jgi:hypothetical protein
VYAAKALYADRAAAQQDVSMWVIQVRHAHRLRIPRRPVWDHSTSPEDLDARERASFLAWRRDLAQCVLRTPVCRPRAPFLQRTQQRIAVLNDAHGRLMLAAFV